MKDTSISIRLDSKLKEQTERVLDMFGLNMTSVINMLFNQIVREQAIPLSLSLKPQVSVAEELSYAVAERSCGYIGRSYDSIADDMEQIIMEAEDGEKGL